jgi:MoaA/NifB/PqqE/SkfB family radical SAM enzyme
MRQHLIFCSDLARLDPSGEIIERIEGWCVCSSQIRSLLLADATGYRLIPYGFERPDVGKAYPDFPSSARSGYRFSTKLPAKEATQFCVEIEDVMGYRARHRFAANVQTRDIQTIVLDETTRLFGEADLLALRALKESSDLEARLHDSLGARRGLTLRLDIINKCNLRCVMCHFSDDAIFKRPTRQLTADQFRALFDDIGPNVREVVLSCGDEPLTSKFLPEILAYLATNHPQVAVEFCTNATLMRAPIRNIIMETGVARLSFSIDAVSKALLEKIRVGCKYEQVVGNIMALRDLKQELNSPRPAFIFNFVMMERNIHEAPAFVRMAKMLGAEAIDFRHVVPIEPWFEPDQLLTRHQAKFNFYREKILSECAALNVNCYLPAPFITEERWEPAEEVNYDLSEFLSVAPDAASPVLPVLPRVLAEREDRGPEGSASDEFAATFCNRPFSEIMVRDEEDILPCPWHGRPLGKLSDGKTLSEVFFGNEFKRLRENMLKPEGDPNCARCPLKSGHLSTQSNN